MRTHSESLTISIRKETTHLGRVLAVADEKDAPLDFGFCAKQRT
jgi:hypothetical protein